MHLLNVIVIVLFQTNEALQKAFDVKMRITTAYHPQSNGLDERTNQTLKRYIFYACDKIYFLVLFLQLYYVLINQHIIVVVFYVNMFRSMSKLMEDYSDNWGKYLDLPFLRLIAVCRLLPNIRHFY